MSYSVELLKGNLGHEISGLTLLKPKIFYDERGFFMESWNQLDFNQAIGKEIRFVQDNHSFSKEGVIRGLHYQLDPHKQGKLVRCISGEIYDVVVDIRKESKNFGNWAGVYLDDQKYHQLWVPEGFAHGFLSLRDSTEVLYKTTRFWSNISERTIHWDDKELSINWPNKNKISLISKKDSEALNLNQIESKDLL